MEGIEEIIKRAFAGPCPAEYTVVVIEQAGSISIDIQETGQKIKKVCMEYGYTVRRLHEELNIGYQSVYAWFAGRAMPSLDNMYQLSSLFDIPMEQMIAETPKIVSFCVQLGETDKNRTAKAMWKYYVRELRSCMYENIPHRSCCEMPRDS